MKIDLIAGARPNFIKISPIINSIKKKIKSGYKIQYRLIHTGQHYDTSMSGNFFYELNIPDPNINFNAGGGSQSEQTAKIMISYEKLLMKERSDFCIVVGDVTSTMACSIVAQKMNVKVVHVEAGIRSGDWTMPEEINRLVTDSITNYFFTTTKIAGENLIKSGINKENIFFVGNTMIDTLLKHKENFIKPSIWNKLNLKNRKYIILTLHRPSNVDEENILKDFINEIINNSADLDIVFPVHPRTSKIIKKIGLNHSRLILIQPLSYLRFNFLVLNSLAVITDSGGITEETTVMGIPCMTLRDNTERPETVKIGTNELVGTNPKKIKKYFNKLLKGNWKKGKIPEKWDGNTSDRIIYSLLKIYDSKNQ